MLARTQTVAWAVLIMVVLGCREQHAPQTKASNVGVNNAGQDPGAHIAPTNDLSFQLLEAEPSVRRAWFAAALAAGKNQCSLVTGAVIKAGENGTDFWRVACDHGAWLFTLADDRTSIENCSYIISPYCADGFNSALARPSRPPEEPA